MATLTATRTDTASGLRPTDLRVDLAGIAALMEQCFGATLDAAGRGAIQEMRLLSKAGPLLWIMGGAMRGPLWNLGFVWVEDGRIVAAQEGHLLATSFHPELTDDGRFHKYFMELATKS